MSLLEPVRTCPECGERGVIPTELPYKTIPATHLCAHCMTFFREDNGIMTAIRGPGDSNQSPRENARDWPVPTIKELKDIFWRRSDFAAEGSAQHYIDRMVANDILRCYDTSHTPPVFTPPELWMLGLEEPMPVGAPHNLLRRARLAELFNPQPPTE